MAGLVSGGADKQPFKIPGVPLVKGDPGEEGLSAYQVAVRNGFTGTQQEWIDSLRGMAGYSAYQIAVQNGFVGTSEEWLASLKGEQGEQGPPGADTQVAIDEIMQTHITDPTPHTAYDDMQSLSLLFENGLV